MSHANIQHIEGFLANDPAINYTPSGTAVVELSIADNIQRRNDQGVYENSKRKIGGTDKYEDDTTWFNVVAYGQLAENVAESLRKGSPVIIEGRTRQQVSEKSGTRITYSKVYADKIALDFRYALLRDGRIERPRKSGDSRSNSGYQRQATRGSAPAQTRAQWDEPGQDTPPF